MDLEQHLKRQIAWSCATFGPGKRTKGVIDHIRKELKEIEESNGSPEEWVDVVILALDGLTRALVNTNTRDEPWYDRYNSAPSIASWMIENKQAKNEQRDWPDWRTQSQDSAIEHIRSESGE